MKTNSAIAIGMSSVRENLVPMVVLWTLAVALAACYCLSDVCVAILAPIARLQTSMGYFAAFLNRLVFCGAIPGAFILALPELRPKRRAVATVVATAVWCGLWGIVCDGFYRLQLECFGAEVTVGTVLAKTLLDQLGFNVLVIAPSSAAFYFWTANGMDFGLTLRRWPRDWMSAVVLPNLITGWCVSLPVTAAVYMFPQPLQVQLSGLASSFWTLVSMGIGRRCITMNGCSRI